jgi:hypothetical protein
MTFKCTVTILGDSFTFTREAKSMQEAYHVALEEAYDLYETVANVDVGELPDHFKDNHIFVHIEEIDKARTLVQ